LGKAENIKIKRVYAPSSTEDGARYLVDRLWPRGMRREDLGLSGWTKDAAPSNELRQWYAHDPARWEEFKRRYYAELEEHPQSWQPLAQAAQAGTITLLYSTREEEYNNAVALKEFLDSRL
jgi:uncharacterized protein YeaO (DUF488 family)